MKTTGTGLASAAAAQLAATRSSAAESEKIVMAGIGCGGQGTHLIRSFAGNKNVELAYVCDPDGKRAHAAAQAVAKIAGKTPKIVTDLRRVLDDSAVNAVTVATPDHWHAPAAILACDAGKHVYVEKPCSHNVREGRLLVEAARRNERVVQHGTQSRSMPLIRQAIDMLRDGVIGKVLVAKAWDVQKRANIGHATASEPPGGFDYDLWLGPAPYVPFQPNRHHYSWHWWYDFGTGDMGNDGVHEIDIARWGLGVDTHPSTVMAAGGKYYFDDDQQFPDTLHVAFEYPGNGQVGERRQLVFEMRIWSPYKLESIDNGNAFYGTDGWMLLSKRGVLKVFGKKDAPIAVKEVRQDRVSHHQNFVDAVRTGGRPNAEIKEGHLSATLCHLGNIGARLGRSLRFDPAKEEFLDDDLANGLLHRKYRDGHWAIPKDV